MLENLAKLSNIFDLADVANQFVNRNDIHKQVFKFFSQNYS